MQRFPARPLAQGPMSSPQPHGTLMSTTFGKPSPMVGCAIEFANCLTPGKFASLVLSTWSIASSVCVVQPVILSSCMGRSQSRLGATCGGIGQIAGQRLGGFIGQPSLPGRGFRASLLVRRRIRGCSWYLESWLCTLVQ